MCRKHHRTAFTLIEVLIVVIIMAVLAATIIPQFSSSTEDAKNSSLRFNLHTIRSQIELYRLHHLGRLPTLADFEDQMTGRTDVEGNPDANGAFGPYIQGEIPANPFNGFNAIVGVANEEEEPTAAVAGDYGWQYNQKTGGFYPNNAQYYQ